jgi:3',5'-cyclic AMP phosphodiesterase CpdA
MVLRLWRHLCLWLAAVMVVLPSSPAASQTGQRIVAVGDLHGDYEAWTAIARDAGLVDAKGRWAGGTTILIQTGDITDRGPDSLKIIRHLQKLRTEAAKAGGQVIVLIGNHEAMNVTGDLRYVDPGEFAAFRNSRSEALRRALWDSNSKQFLAAYKTRYPAMTDEEIRADWQNATPLGMIEHQRAWAPGGELGRWAASLPAVVKLGDSLFVHGGLSAAYTAMGGIDEINRRVRAAVATGDKSPNSILFDPLGPLWYRGLITRGPAFEQEVAAAAAAAGKPNAARPPIDQELDLVLTAFGARRLVVAHTPSLKGIDISHGGKLVRIDTGNSRHYKGQPSWLEVNGGQLISHNVARSMN